MKNAEEIDWSSFIVLMLLTLLLMTSLITCLYCIIRLRRQLSNEQQVNPANMSVDTGTNDGFQMTEQGLVRQTTNTRTEVALVIDQGDRRLQVMLHSNTNKPSTMNLQRQESNYAVQ